METEQKQKKFLFAGLTILVFAGILLYVASFLDRNTAATQNVETPKEELTGAAAYSATLPPSYWFLLDAWGYSPPTDEDDTPVRHSVRVGTEVPIGAGVNEYADFDPSRIKVAVNGRQLPTAPRAEGGMIVQVATYIPKSPGKELIEVEIIGTTHRESVEVSAYAKELMSETRLISEDVSWEGNWAGETQIDTVKPFEDFSTESLGYDEPGYLRIKKTDELIRTEGELRIYDISVLEKYRNDEPLPYFYEHILNLERYLAERGELSDQESNEIFSYPRTNAAIIRLERDKFVDGKEFDGVSYIHAGHFQSYDPARQPTYIYQGISHDKKFFVFYRQELYSDSLRKYLRKNDRCFEKECIEGSFNLLQRDQDLDPNPAQLNDVVKSLTIRKL